MSLPLCQGCAKAVADQKDNTLCGDCALLSETDLKKLIRQREAAEKVRANPPANKDNEIAKLRAENEALRAELAEKKSSVRDR